jgi:hypothetical protein
MIRPFHVLKTELYCQGREAPIWTLSLASNLNLEMLLSIHSASELVIRLNEVIQDSTLYSVNLELWCAYCRQKQRKRL